MVNTNLLKGKIAAAGYTQKALAPVIGMSKNTLNAKVKGRKNFNTHEIARICDVLSIIDPAEKCNIFLS